MNSSILTLRRRLLVVLTLAAISPLPGLAAPGAHGPNGEHLDQQDVVAVGAARPRVEAKSESFELVANLEAGLLVILVDRYATNAPVLDAQLEVEVGSHKAVATFRPDSGDYVTTDPALIEAIASPGEHALLFTLVTGEDADLLDGTLVNSAYGGAVSAGAGHGQDDHDHDNDNDHDHDHGHELERAALIGGGVLALGLLAVAIRNRRRSTHATKGVK